MKLITDDGQEHKIISRRQARRLIRELVPPDDQCGPKTGKHVAKVASGRIVRYAYRFIDHGQVYQGPCRETEAEAVEDWERLQVRTPIALSALKTRSSETRALMSMARRNAYQAALAANGEVKLGPPTCRGCGTIGHRASFCPASGWVKSIYVPKKKSQTHHCSFCAAQGHNAMTCQKRRAAIGERLRRRAA
jgi:hypothetical protein